MLKERKINIEKAATMSAVLNAVEVAVLVGLLLIDTLGLLAEDSSIWRPLFILAILMLIVEGVLSIRDAFLWRGTNRQNEMLKATYGQLDELNNQLRMQRHDFLNHLQVVYSLVDMGEQQEATQYIEHVYGQMRRLSQVMKTAKPAVNALLAAKLANAEKRNIQVTLRVASNWKNLPITDWEMCRVLGNLMDNAMDALEAVSDRKMTVELYEDLRNYRFRVSNNGPMIPRDVQARIFNLGFTTKATGQGLGLHIVKEVLDAYGGEISVVSDAQETAFSGAVPRNAGTAGAQAQQVLANSALPNLPACDKIKT